MRRSWLVIAAAVALAGALAIGLVVKTGGRPARPAPTSVDEAVDRAYEAIGKADYDALVALSGGDALRERSGCPDRDRGRDEHEPFARAIADAHGSKFVVSQVREENVMTDRQGCTKKLDVTIHMLLVDLDVTRNGHTRHKIARMTVLEIDRGYYLLEPPKIDEPDLMPAE